MVYGVLTLATANIILLVKKYQVSHQISNEILLKKENFELNIILGQCPDNWVPFKNKCYLINSDRQKFTTWFDANTTCSNFGANFVSINE